MERHETQAQVTRNNVYHFDCSTFTGGWVVEWTAPDGRKAQVSCSTINARNYAVVSVDRKQVAESNTGSWIVLMAKAINYLSVKHNFGIVSMPEWPRTRADGTPVGI